MAARCTAGSVSTFCLEHNTTREAFYAIRKGVAVDGLAATFEPCSRRPRASPCKLSDDIPRQAGEVRSALEQSGLEHGSVNAHAKMRPLGTDPVPSVGSLARILRDAHVARLETRKELGASYRRFVYPALKACWQLDATEYVFSGGQKCAISQLIDDHSRLAVASLVAWGETSEGVLPLTEFDSKAADRPIIALILGHRLLVILGVHCRNSGRN